jgi:hypothetical protein
MASAYRRLFIATIQRYWIVDLTERNYMSLKANLLSLRGSLKIERVNVVDLSEPVYIRSLTGRERDAFESACFQQRGKTRVLNTENIRAKLLCRALCDEKGARLFADTEVDAVGDLPAAVLDELFTIAQRLSGLSSNDVEELAGNSEGAAQDASTSDSR